MERPRDVIWDVLVELYGDVANSNERGRRNKSVENLKQAGGMTPIKCKDSDIIIYQTGLSIAGIGVGCAPKRKPLTKRMV